MPDNEQSIRINKIITRFKEIKEEITINHPVICSIDKILKYNKKEKFITVLIEDQNEEKILAFLYGYLSVILNSESVRNRLPLKITIIKGELKESRKEGLSLNGEYSVENLVFKMLRNNEHIDRLHAIKQEIYNKDMSIENTNK